MLDTRMLDGIFVLLYVLHSAQELGMPPAFRNRLGVITSGSLVEGLCARLEGRESVEDMRVGKFVVIKGEKNEFFSMICSLLQYI